MEEGERRLGAVAVVGRTLGSFASSRCSGRSGEVGAARSAGYATSTGIFAAAAAGGALQPRKIITEKAG